VLNDKGGTEHFPLHPSKQRELSVEAKAALRDLRTQCDEKIKIRAAVCAQITVDFRTKPHPSNPRRRDWIKLRDERDALSKDIEDLRQRMMICLREISREEKQDEWAMEHCIAGNPCKLVMPPWRSETSGSGINIVRRDDS
jgi:hypothetical protein